MVPFLRDHRLPAFSGGARERPGATLIELLLFISIVSVVSFMMLPLLYSATENRLMQQTASLVEQNGMQLLQTIAYHAQDARRILDPVPQGVGAVLALQTDSGAVSPTIIGVQSGALVIITGTLKEMISSPQVTVDQFVVRNTSRSPAQQSLLVSFRVSRMVPLRTMPQYVRSFEAAFTLSPRDVPPRISCSCASSAPVCLGGSSYRWQTCQGATCAAATTGLDCAVSSSAGSSSS